MLLLMVQAAEADRDERLEQMLSLSDIAAVMISYPEQIHRQLYRPGAIIDDAEVATVEARLVSAYKALDTESALYSYASERISPAQLDAILAWYDSPLGRRLLAAERQAETAAGREEMKGFLLEFDRHPAADSRIRLIRRFEQIARLSYINLAVIRALYETEFVAANDMRPQQLSLDDGKLRTAMERQFDGSGGLLLTGLAANMMAVSYYTLRSFSDSDVAAYIDFLETGAGRALVRLYEDAPVYLFAQVVRHAGMQVPENFFLTADRID